MRQIPEDNLAYPVLINLPNSTGSGFFLSQNKNFFLITAKHVLCDSNGHLMNAKIKLICQTISWDDRSVYELEVDLSKTKPLLHENTDVAAIKIGEFEDTTVNVNRKFNFQDGVKQLRKGNATIVHVNENGIKLIGQVLVGNDVFMSGYPTSIGLKNMPQFDYFRPLLRKGVIADVYKEQGTIILDCPSYYGNSGGPVVEINNNGLICEYKVIGVVSQFIPFVQQWTNNQNGLINTEFANSGYSVIVGMDAVLEVLSKNIK